MKQQWTLYVDSQERMKKFTEGKRMGFMNWEVYHTNFKLECWNIKGDDGKVQPTIFQLWQNGNGFTEYKAQ